MLRGNMISMLTESVYEALRSALLNVAGRASEPIAADEMTVRRLRRFGELMIIFRDWPSDYTGASSKVINHDRRSALRSPVQAGQDAIQDARTGVSFLSHRVGGAHCGELLYDEPLAAAL